MFKNQLKISYYETLKKTEILAILEGEGDRIHNQQLNFILFSKLNDSESYALEFFDLLKNKLSKADSIQTYQYVLLIAKLTYNCQDNFQNYIATSEFQDVFYKKYLQAKNSKFKWLKIDHWNSVQSKILYLYQLWCDTFYMEHERFKEIFRKYFALLEAKEDFPPRTLNSKNLIPFKGTQSPILQNIDEFARRDLIKANKQKFKIWKDMIEEFEKESMITLRIIAIPDIEVQLIDETVQLAYALLNTIQNKQDIETVFTKEIMLLIEQSYYKLRAIDLVQTFQSREQKEKCQSLIEDCQKIMKTYKRKVQKQSQRSSTESEKTEQFKEKHEKKKKSQVMFEEEEEKSMLTTQ